MIPSPHDFLNSCASQKILVIGDVMIDRYLRGNIDRISPEAPVPVVDITEEEERLGGAGNVAINLSALGAEVHLICIAGQDDRADRLGELMQQAGFTSEGVIREADRKTSSKTRILSQGQQMLRVDRESTSVITAKSSEMVLTQVRNKLADVNGIILQDYDKGLLHPDLISSIISLAAKQGVPVFVDPKFRNFTSYQGATVFKPNWREFSAAIGIEAHPMPSPEEIILLAKSFRDRMPHDHSLITLGAKGMLCIDQNGEADHIHGKPREVSDVSGAGDTVLSVMALAMMAGYTPVQSATFANLAGGIVCEESGVVPVSPQKLQAEISATYS